MHITLCKTCVKVKHTIPKLEKSGQNPTKFDKKIHQNETFGVVLVSFPRVFASFPCVFTSLCVRFARLSDKIYGRGRVDLLEPFIGL